jgi:hypothetical protein
MWQRYFQMMELSNCVGLASVSAPGACIRVIRDRGVLYKGFGKALAAAAIDHAAQ